MSTYRYLKPRVPTHKTRWDTIDITDMNGDEIAAALAGLSEEVSLDSVVVESEGDSDWGPVTISLGWAVRVDDPTFEKRMETYRRNLQRYEEQNEINKPPTSRTNHPGEP